MAQTFLMRYWWDKTQRDLLKNIPNPYNIFDHTHNERDISFKNFEKLTWKLFSACDLVTNCDTGNDLNSWVRIFVRLKLKFYSKPNQDVTDFVFLNCCFFGCILQFSTA